MGDKYGDSADHGRIGTFWLLETVCDVGSNIVVLERVEIQMLTEARNNVILKDIVLVVLCIRSARTDTGSKKFMVKCLYRSF